jgi:glycosyltransferase involved in cell wall biosynthesis
VLWYYTPAAIDFTRDLQADVIVYDNMDELSGFLGASPLLLAQEKALFDKADLVFTGGISLYGVKRRQHPNVHAFPSSIDADHYLQARSPQTLGTPPDQEKIPTPRIGFFGVIDERLDLELLAALAQARPDWQFVMIGPVVKIDPDALPMYRNLHWLGAKPYADLPSYLAGWDAGFMPFALNEATHFISPTKTLEFLAAGVPLVSTPITDVVNPYGERELVEIADAAGTFETRIGAMLNRRKDPKSFDLWLKLIDLHLATTSWDKSWRSMNDLLMREMSESRQNQRADTENQQTMEGADV